MRIIVNPAAGGGRVGREWPRLEARLQAAGLDFDVAHTQAPGHAGELAAAAVAAGHQVVVAAGGDGTICEVLAGLRNDPRQPGREPGRATLGILPLGTGNDAVRTLGIPLDVMAAAAVLRTGVPRAVDLMSAGERVVLNAIGIGLLGAINVNSTSIKWVRGIGAYLVAAVGTLFDYPCPVIELTAEGPAGPVLYRGPMTILAIHNGVTTGGGFRLCPRALPADGELDATLVRDTSVRSRLGAVAGALRGTLGRRADTQELRFHRLTLTCAERLPYHWDGNPAHIDPPGMTFEVLPGAQRVLVPAPA